MVWIVGASSGIGKQLAIILAQNGVRLCISARRGAKLEEVKRECLAKSKILQLNDIVVLEMDVLEMAQHSDCLERVVKHFGVLDILVNNAGRSQQAKWADIDITIDRQIFELNVFGAVNLTRLYLRHLKAVNNSSGHVVVTSSIKGLIALPGSSSYVAAKHALQVFKF